MSLSKKRRLLLPPLPESACPAPVVLVEAGTWLLSDVHLSAHTPRTNAAFCQTLARARLEASGLIILGDLFEVWLGDDSLSLLHDESSPFSWLLPIIDALAAFGSHRPLWIGRGNRDFLLGEAFAARVAGHLLADIAHLRLSQSVHTGYAVCHGDTLCTDDTDYREFRTQVRADSWRENFMSLPLTERMSLVANLRQGSEQRKQQLPAAIMDVNQDAVNALMRSLNETGLIHGHTHRPDHHVWQHQGRTQERWVLPDWDFDGSNPRGGWLVLQQNDAPQSYCAA